MKKPRKSSGFLHQVVKIWNPTGKIRRPAKDSRRKPIVVGAGVFVAGMLVSVSLASSAPPVYKPSDIANAIAKVIHADDAQSAALPGGRILWTWGDTLEVNGISTSGAYGYPHDAMAIQQADTLKFTVLAGKYGYGWQQVPNWSNGDYFWMSTPIVYNNTVYVIGSRVRGASNFTIIGQYAAEFNAQTLAYERIVALPSGTSNTTWGGVFKGVYGWWLSGTHAVACSYATDCKVGDFAFVPFGDLTNAAKWQWHADAVPAALNAGTTLGVYRTKAGWDIFTKQGDSYGGSAIEELSAPAVAGTWKVTGTWPIPSPSGTVTYGVAVHPEQPASPGQILVSYNTNGNTSDYGPSFMYLAR